MTIPTGTKEVTWFQGCSSEWDDAAYFCAQAVQDGIPWEPRDQAEYELVLAGGGYDQDWFQTHTGFWLNFYVDHVISGEK